MGWIRRLLIGLVLMVVISRLAADNETDFDATGVTMSLSAEDLVNAVLPKLIQALANNTTLQNAIVQAIMPGIRAQMATLARSTGGAGTTTPRTGPQPQ